MAMDVTWVSVLLEVQGQGPQLWKEQEQAATAGTTAEAAGASQQLQAGSEQEQQAQQPDTEELQQALKSLPAHSVILSRSPYFKHR